MFLQSKPRRRSCLLAFAIGIALAPFLALVFLSERLGRLAVQKGKGQTAHPPAPPTGHRCADLPEPRVDVAKWALRVTGQVEKPASFSLEDLKEFKARRCGLPMACAQGWVYHATWCGISMDEIVLRVKPLPAAKWVEFIAADGYRECCSLSELLSLRALLAYWLNDGPLPPHHGAPLRLIVPTKLGYKNVKWITEIAFHTQRSKGYLADKLTGYDAMGTIPAGFPHRVTPPAAR